MWLCCSESPFNRFYKAHVVANQRRELSFGQWQCTNVRGRRFVRRYNLEMFAIFCLESVKLSITTSKTCGASARTLVPRAFLQQLLFRIWQTICSQELIWNVIWSKRLSRSATVWLCLVLSYAVCGMVLLNVWFILSWSLVVAVDVCCCMTHWARLCHDRRKLFPSQLVVWRRF